MLKIIFSVLVLFFLFKTIDVRNMQFVLAKVSLGAFALSCFCVCLCYVLFVYRWYKIVLQVVDIPFKTVFDLSVRGNFFSQVLPSSVGGDVYKVYALSTRGLSAIKATAAVLVDRVFGLFVMGLLAAASLFVIWPFIAVDPWWMWSCVGYIFCAFFMCVLLWWVTRGNVKESLIYHIVVLLKTTLFIPSFYFWLASTVATILLFLPIAIFCHDLQMNVSLAAILFLMPVVCVLTFLPISFAGWGIREYAFISMMAVFGVSNEEVVTVSVLYGTTLLIVSVVVYTVWWGTQNLKRLIFKF